MAADILYINDKYLEKANYNLCVGDNLYVASYQEKILLGPIQYDDVTGKAKFTKKSVTIPSLQYVDFVSCFLCGNSHCFQKSFFVANIGRSV